MLGIGVSMSNQAQSSAAMQLPYNYPADYSGSFDGTNDIVICQNSAPVGHPLKPTNAVTLSVFVRPFAWDYYNYDNSFDKVYIAGNLATGCYALLLQKSGTDTFIKWQVGVADDGTGSPGYLIATSTSPMNTQLDGPGTTGPFQMLVGTFDGNVATLYIQGNTTNSGGTTEAGFRPSAANYPASYPTTIDYVQQGLQVTEFAIGASNQHGDYIKAQIDDVAVWNSCLTSAEVAKLRDYIDPVTGNSSIIPFDLRRTDISGYNSSSNLVGYWSFDEGQGTQTADLVGVADGIFTNGATWSNANPRTPNP